MTNIELLDLFFSRYIENEYNEKILDDIDYIVPKANLHKYVNNLLNIPYDQYIDFLLNYNLGEITSLHITQSSSFRAAEIDMCRALLSRDNVGFTLIEIGEMFPEFCKADTPLALKKYGENQIKTSSQLGLAYQYYGKWYLNCLGYIYEELSQEDRNKLLARTILRDNLYGNLVKDIVFNDITLDKYLKGLSQSTINRRTPSILRILKLALDELEICGLEHGSCNFNLPKMTSESTIKGEETQFLFSKKLTKSFLSQGTSIPLKSNSSIFDIVPVEINKGESVPISIIFENKKYKARLNHINFTNSDRELYQIYWNKQSNLSNDLTNFVSKNKIENFHLYGIPKESIFIISSDSENTVIKKVANDIHQAKSIAAESEQKYSYNYMASLTELYQTKKVLEELNQDIPTVILNQIQKLEAEEISNIPNRIVSQLPKSINQGELQGDVTIIVEYSNGSLKSVYAHKNTYSQDDKDVRQEQLNVKETLIYESISSINQTGSIPYEMGENFRKTRTMFSLNGSAPMSKNRAVLASVKLLLSEFPSVTFEDVLEMFPKELQGSYGVVRTIDDIVQRQIKNKTEKMRWFMDDNDILTASDGIQFAVSSEWGNNFGKFQEHIKDSWGWELKEIITS